MEVILQQLTDKDDDRAFKRTKEIAAVSEFSPEYYSFLEQFASLLQNSKTYIRTRAFILCCSQARWDDEGRIRKILPDMLKLLHDPKPTVVRQCLNAVQELIVFRPELCSCIRKEVESIDLSAYRETMVPLIQKDIGVVLQLLDGQA